LTPKLHNPAAATEKQTASRCIRIYHYIQGYNNIILLCSLLKKDVNFIEYFYKLI